MQVSLGFFSWRDASGVDIDVHSTLAHPVRKQMLPRTQIMLCCSPSQGVAGIEPLFFPEDEEALLPKELHMPLPSREYGSHPTSHNERRGQNGDAPGNHNTNIGGDSGGRAEETKHQRQQQLPYDRHSVHVVTQYYVPDDPRRAREVCAACMLAGLFMLCTLNAL